MRSDERLFAPSSALAAGGGGSGGELVEASNTIACCDDDAVSIAPLCDALVALLDASSNIEFTIVSDALCCERE